MTHATPGDHGLLLRLYEAASELRDAQRCYLANRGDEGLGKRVGEKAAQLDEVLAEVRNAVLTSPSLSH